MKMLLAICLAVLPLFGQPEVGGKPSAFLDSEGNFVAGPDGAAYRVFYEFHVGANGTKVLDYSVCKLLPDLPLFGLAVIFAPLLPPNCKPLDQSVSQAFSFVQSLKSTVINWAAAANAPYKINYLTTSGLGLRPALSMVLPAAPPNPFLTFVDGLGGNVMKFDLTAGSVVGQVQPPSTAIGPVGLRPGAAGSTNEVWVANETPQVTVTDLGSQKILANIATPSIPTPFVPVGIVFSNSGNTAFEAVQFSAPDSLGNDGALVVFDAVKRAVQTTFPLRYGPSVMLMAPDGLTIYLLSAGGMITYYDVLSGTADLNASTYAPGSNGGYPATSNAFIHPDGTRLFWNVGTYVEVFDLTTRKVTNQFNSGLPTVSAVSLQVSQDGSLAIMANGLGNVVVLDTRHGAVLASTQYPTATLTLSGN